MMVELSVAIITEVAMRRPWWSKDLTALTELEFEDLRRIDLV